ncbi:MAG TPA: M1 family aminopeptidase [Thermoanaerobaculia bacterium]|nr:M1 family aminopeptidase [Thermoanaerobaculia bacterium]
MKNRLGSILSLLLGLVLLGPAAIRGATLAERAAAIDAPALGKEVKLSGPLQVGRAEIVPAEGTRVRALIAGGTPCGLVVEGPARLRYRVEDRFSAPVAERNVRRASSLSATKAGQGIEIATNLDGAVIWGWGLSPAEETAAAATASDSRQLDWAAKLLTGRRFAPPSHGLLTAEANGVTGLRYALLRTRNDLLLHVDPRAGEETLYRLERSIEGTTFREGLWLTSLAAQPIGRAWWDRPPADLIAEHERIAIENPAGAQLRIVTRSRLRARRTGTSLWQASLVDRIYDQGGDRHPVTVRSVRVDGRAADFLHRDGEILVPLGRALADKETVEVEVAYDGELAQRPSGHSYWALGTWPWYPRRELEGELATMEITVDVPEPWTPFASGAETARTSEGGRRKLTTRLDQPMQFAVVTAGKYQVIEETQDGVTCRAATYAMLKEKAARELIARFFVARRFFEQLFDEPYPFRDFTMIEINDWGFGQAPPGVIFLTKEFYTAPVDRRSRVFFQDLNARYLHEVAHGWWGNVAKMNSFEESWLTEALADYTAALALWQLRREGRGAYELNEIVKDWVKATGELSPGASLYFIDRLALNNDTDRADYWRLRYAKGPLVLHALRLELQRQKGSPEEGDRYFIALLRTYLKRHRYGWGTTRGLVETLDQLTGGNWQPWFERYVYGTEIPSLPK